RSPSHWLAFLGALALLTTLAVPRWTAAEVDDPSDDPTVGTRAQVGLNENFDQVKPPNLPAGWQYTYSWNCPQSPPVWQTFAPFGTTASGPDTAPNVAYAP